MEQFKEMCGFLTGIIKNINKYMFFFSFSRVNPPFPPKRKKNQLCNQCRFSLEVEMMHRQLCNVKEKQHFVGLYCIEKKIRITMRMDKNQC